MDIDEIPNSQSSGVWRHGAMVGRMTGDGACVSWWSSTCRMRCACSFCVNINHEQVKPPALDPRWDYLLGTTRKASGEK